MPTIADFQIITDKTHTIPEGTPPQITWRKDFNLGSGINLSKRSILMFMVGCDGSPSEVELWINSNQTDGSDARWKGDYKLKPGSNTIQAIIDQDAWVAGSNNIRFIDLDFVGPQSIGTGPTLHFHSIVLHFQRDIT